LKTSEPSRGTRAEDQKTRVQGERSSTAERHRIPGWLFTTVMLLWWFGGYGAVVYSLVEDRGPFTFLLRWQDALFGGSNVMLGAVVAGVVIFLGPQLLVRKLRRLWPTNAVLADLDSQMDSASRSRSEIVAEANAQWADADTNLRVRILRFTRNAWLIIAAGALLVALVIATWVRVIVDADAGQPLTRVAVSRDTPLVQGRVSNWVHLTQGTPLQQAALPRDYTIRGHAYRDYYTPIVAPGWQAGDRLYLLEEDDTPSGDPNTSSSAYYAGSIEGELSFDGPREDVMTAFVHNGYQVGAWTAVLRRKRDLDGKVPGEDWFTYWMIWGVGVLFAAMGLILALIKQYQLRRIVAGGV
jgi:hypothetical protein